MIIHPIYEVNSRTKWIRYKSLYSFPFVLESKKRKKKNRIYNKKTTKKKTDRCFNRLIYYKKTNDFFIVKTNNMNCSSYNKSNSDHADALLIGLVSKLPPRVY